MLKEIEMRKILIYVIILGFSMMIISCEEIDYPSLFQTISEEIESSVPEIVNNDFDLPSYTNVEVTYELNGLSFGGAYEYVSPFYDLDTTLSYQIKKNDQTYEGSVDVRLLAGDSGENNYELHLSLPESVENVTRETYMQASVIAKRNHNGVEETELETTAAQIRGRGNSTWFSYPKKPFRLRFDENTSIFGMPEAKNYVLLAEYADKSLMRNTIVHKLSSLSDVLPYTLETRFVELYINTTYMGLYVLTEQVETHKNKLDINPVAGVADTGYLLELDMRFFDQSIEPGYDWIVVNGIPYEIKDPNVDDEGFSSVHADFMFTYLKTVDEALLAKSDYESLIDVDAFIDYFIIQELVKNVDVGYSSVFYMKEAGGLLQPGPLWDFDFAIGNADYIDYGPENFYGMKEYKNRLFKLMMDIPEIREQYRIRFHQYYLDQLPKLYEMIPILSASIGDQVAKNFDKWQILDEYVWPNPQELVEANTFALQVIYIDNYLKDRAEWLLTAMDQDDYEEGVFE
jgi:spore coat protein CotH